MGGAQISSSAPRPRHTTRAGLVPGSGALTRADQRLVGVGDHLAALLPEGGLRRGSTVRLGGTGGTSSMALALVAATTERGAWVAAVGLPALGLVAAAQLGVGLERLALVPSPGAQWAVVTAALLDSVEIVLVVPGGRVGGADARRLVARARERGAVLVVVDPQTGPGRGRWPEAPDLQLVTAAAVWEGVEEGAGHLRSRAVDVVVSGRRAASASRTWRVLLPGPDGRVRCCVPEPAPAAAAPLAPVGVLAG